MAKAIGQQTRGRKKDALRVFAEANVSKAGAGTDAERTVAFVPDSKLDAEVTISIPRAALFIPRDLTAGKSDGTVRQTLRTVLNLAGISGEVHSYTVERDDNGERESVWYVTGEAKPAATRKPAARKGASK